MLLISLSASQYWYTQKVMKVCASSLQNLLDLQILNSGLKFPHGKQNCSSILKNICAGQSLKAWFYGGSRQEWVKNANRLACKANKNNH